MASASINVQDVHAQALPYAILSVLNNTAGSTAVQSAEDWIRQGLSVNTLYLGRLSAPKSTEEWYMLSRYILVQWQQHNTELVNMQVGMWTAFARATVRTH